jgi:hypothetical protein
MRFTEWRPGDASTNYECTRRTAIGELSVKQK